ncbi:MAG: hypothetical protein UZ06_CHB003000107 [Chlorobi bacterium OLB6]|nr:MAG: hypothetical protein UZ06_CHB003000107 [Chlorobi bacterium OLB6]
MDAWSFPTLDNNQPNHALDWVMVVSSCHTTYAPFGSVLTTTGTGQRTGYIGREEDNETGLGNYGVRLYEPEYGRFMSVDVLWGEYEGWQPYQYALNAPLSFRDEGGKWVQAMNEAARDAIRNSVPAQFRSAIQFSERGVVLREPLLAAARGQDVNSNVAILSRLAENESTIIVKTGDGYNSINRNTGNRENTEFQDYNGGITLPPACAAEKLGINTGVPVSTSGMFEVHINASISEVAQGKIAAHELFAHISLLLQALLGKV